MSKTRARVLREINTIIETNKSQIRASKDRYHNALSQGRASDAAIERKNQERLQHESWLAHRAIENVKKSKP